MLTRRVILAAAVGGALAGVTGCVRRDPTVSGRPTGTPSADRSPSPVALAQYAGLPAGLAAAVRAGAPGADRLGGFRDRAAAAFDAQAAVLAPGTTATAPAGSLADSAHSAGAQLLGASARGTAAARLAAAGAYAAAIGSLASTTAPRTPTEGPSSATVTALGDAEAMTALITQLSAAVYATEAALAHFSGEDTRWARATLDGHRATLDGLAAELTRRSVRVPAPAVAYDIGRPSDAASAATLMARVQTAVLPDACRVVRAATDDGVRTLGASALQDAAVAVARSGGALPVWPGWA
ncbi:DUF4439 domain-containing protein [Raineyella fluvialis]|uniref:DUF4439 domain-containing protein n=1 Tax=Raineyella fluvialis TaxID=2662261 RepID=A0A5Q2FJU9_9ACTN|nr:DUF4439 domain-containing protein [Raineyella fluvialis]QGF24935.1 DUF4439 domain-containing protein [Raineyella fluvialis]